MMGISRTLEESRQLSEAVQRRKAAVAASLGKTVEEFDRDAHAACAPRAASNAGEADGANEQDEASVSEEQVLAFIRGREEKIEALKEQVRRLKLDNGSLAAKLSLSERKVEALRTGLASARAELAELKAASAAAEAQAQAKTPGV